jgi:2-methylcitrate dehydratase PrpD
MAVKARITITGREMNNAGAPGLSLQLATGLLAIRFDELQVTTVHAAARALLDAVGVMQAASALAPEVAPFIAHATASGGNPEATILGTGLRAPAALAAFANGAMAHSLDYEDAFDRAPLHPNAALIPALLSLAQADRTVSGSALLAALAVGCETACRIALSLRQPLEDGGWYPPPILGAWGAVAGAAHLLRLSPQRLLDAWSLMLLQTSTPGEIKHGEESSIRAVREAFPAQAAVSVAQLASRGVRGFTAPLEGRDGFFRLFAGGRYDAAGLRAPWGQRWYIEQLSFKPWPSCRGTHAAIECALRLRASIGDVSKLSRIVVEGGEVHQMLVEPRARKIAPAGAIEAKFSLPFTVAAALHDGAVTLDTFSAPNLARPDLRALAGRVEFEQRADWGRDQSVCGALRLVLADGRELREEILDPLGSPQRALDDAALIAKFVDCAGRARQPLPATDATVLAGRLLGLQREPSVAALPW